MSEQEVPTELSGSPFRLKSTYPPLCRVWDRLITQYLSFHPRDLTASSSSGAHGSQVSCNQVESGPKPPGGPKSSLLAKVLDQRRAYRQGAGRLGSSALDTIREEGSTSAATGGQKETAARDGRVVNCLALEATQKPAGLVPTPSGTVFHAAFVPGVEGDDGVTFTAHPNITSKVAKLNNPKLAYICPVLGETIAFKGAHTTRNLHRAVRLKLGDFLSRKDSVRVHQKGNFDTPICCNEVLLSNVDVQGPWEVSLAEGVVDEPGKMRQVRNFSPAPCKEWYGL